METLPGPTTVTSKYGAIVSTVQQQNNKVTYAQQIMVFKGNYPVDEYEQIKQFFKQVNALKSKTVVFIKKTAGK